METIHDRLKQSRKAKNYPSAAQAAEAMGMSPPTYVHHENGTRGITKERAQKYAEFFGVPHAWLLLGKSSGTPSPFDQGAREFDRVANPDAPEYLDPDRPLTAGSVTGRQGIPVDAIAQLDASGGMGGGGLTIINEGVPGRHGMTFSAEAISDYWRLPNSILSTLSLRNTDIIVIPVKGNSMAPVLLEGDHLFVDTRHRWASPDGIYALADDFDEIIVKTLRSVDGPKGEMLIEIVSANPEFPVRTKKPDDIRIIGRVIRKFSTVGTEWSASVLENISRITKAEVMDRKRIRDVIVRVEEEFSNSLTPDQKCEMIMSIYDGHEPRFTRKKQDVPPEGKLKSGVK